MRPSRASTCSRAMHHGLEHRQLIEHHHNASQRRSYGAVPAALDIHLVLDNYGTRKTAMIRQWLQKRPRYHLHFAPTHASWLNQVERWFGHCQLKTLRDILIWERCGSCARLGCGYFPPDRGPRSQEPVIARPQ